MCHDEVVGFRILAGFGALALASAAHAQQPNQRGPAPAAPYPLESLRVTGNRRLPADRIIAASGMKIGAKVDKAAFDAARDRLVATGAFENVGYEYKPSAAGTGYDGVIEVVEIEPVYAYRFEDLTLDETALRATLRREEPLFDNRIPSTGAVVARYTKAVEQAAGVQVTVQLTADGPGPAVFVFHPAAPRPNIAEIRFQGNRIVTADTLQRTLYQTAIGKPFSDANMRRMLDLGIRPLYDARGRLRVTFPSIDTGKAKNVDGVAVTITVDEGPAYALGEARLTGVPANEVSQMDDLMAWRKGEEVNFDDIRAGLDKVKQRSYSRGFLHVSAHSERAIDDANHTVDVTAIVELGPQFTFGKLTISGLDILSEPVVRKMWKLAPGKPFQPEYPDAFLAGVRDEGVFDNLGKTRAETNVDEKNHIVDVTLYFNGAGPQPKESPRRTQF